MKILAKVIPWFVFLSLCLITLIPFIISVGYLDCRTEVTINDGLFHMPKENYFVVKVPEKHNVFKSSYIWISKMEGVITKKKVIVMNYHEAVNYIETINELNRLVVERERLNEEFNRQN